MLRTKFQKSRTGSVWSAPVLMALTACNGAISLPAGPNGRSLGATVGDGDGTGIGTGEGDGTSTPAEVSLPITVRKLTNAEYDASVKDLLDLNANAENTFAADVRNSWFTPSMAQRVDETRGDQLRVAAEQLAAQAVTSKLDKILPCGATDGDACAKKFIKTFATKAFRRPSTSDEETDLLTVFKTAATGGVFNDGVQAVVQAVLQSASFLYIPQLGTGTGATRELGPYEIASALSYFVLGAPPDQGLLDAAAANKLSSANERIAHFKRLTKSDPRARTQMQRFIKEWLATDQLDLAVPVVTGLNFDLLRPEFEQETSDFVNEVVFGSGSSFTALIGASFTMANQSLADFYGVTGPTSDTYVKTSLDSSPRRGILMQGSFLAGHAAVDNSSPVKRGATILRRLFCQDISFPSGDLAKTAMIIPPPMPNQTTRQRFAAHSTNPVCAACHAQIDPLGFAFENFNQAGQFRATDNGQKVDASGELKNTDVDGPYKNGIEFVDKLSKSVDVHRCFARNVYRFGATTISTDGEVAFLAAWDALGADKQDNILEIFGAFVQSDTFISRSAQ